MEHYCIKNRKHVAQFFEEFKRFDLLFFDENAKLITPEPGIAINNVIAPLGEEFVHLYVVDVRIHTIQNSRANIIIIRPNNLRNNEFETKTIKPNNDE